MIRTFVAMREVDPGFTRPEEVQTFVLAIPPASSPTTSRRRARTSASPSGWLSVPGVTSVGLSSSITMDGEDNGNTIDVEEGAAARKATMPPLRRFKSFGAGLFRDDGQSGWSRAARSRGARFTSSGRSSSSRRRWRASTGRSRRWPIGKRIRAQQRNAPWREIVGVAGDERDDGLNKPATAIVYWPMLNESYRWRTMAYAVRSPRVGTPGFLRELEQAVWSVDRNLPLADVQTLAEIQARSMAQTSFALVMLGIAAGVALLIGMVGIYGVIAYAATQRTREIGVRMALGAQAADVRTDVPSPRALADGDRHHPRHRRRDRCSRGVMSAFLFGVGPMDLLTYAVVSIVLAAVALLATYLPARRAARVDPMLALRGDESQPRGFTPRTPLHAAPRARFDGAAPRRVARSREVIFQLSCTRRGRASYNQGFVQ